MNSSATRVHLQSKLGWTAHQYARSRSIALRPWRNAGRDTRDWHLRNAKKCLADMARLELAIIYLGMRLERARGCAHRPFAGRLTRHDAYCDSCGETTA